MGWFDFLKKKKRSEKANPTESATPAKPVAAAKRSFQLYTGTGVCDVCNRPLNGQQAWIVPNEVFYASPKYRQRHREQMRIMGMSPLDADTALETMRKMDTSPGSAICGNCIHMFK